ncbi:hypothetical protein OA79_00945 [Marinomonas sp. TW1]|nr:hypothetical protein OA79_00945 [Marinomonas sp. TW1]
MAIFCSMWSIATEYPLTIEHKFGTTVISGLPKRVATVDWGGGDNLLALGYQPLTVRYWFGDNESGVWPWAQPYLNTTPELIRGELNFEQIAKTNPDVIIAIRSGISKEDYEQLSKIAPVVAAPKDVGMYMLTWEERAQIIGKVVNKELEVAARIADIKRKIESVKASHPDWSNKTLAMATYWNGSVGVYSEEDVTVRLKTELGLRVDPRINALSSKGNFYTTISEEQLFLLDADILFWYTGEGAKEKIESLVLRPHLRAYKEGREVFLSTSSILNGAISYGSLLSLPVAIETIVPLIEQAIDGDPNTKVMNTP